MKLGKTKVVSENNMDYYEGEKVELVDEYLKWYLIKTVNGLLVWLTQ